VSSHRLARRRCGRAVGGSSIGPAQLVDLKTIIIEHRDAVAAGDALHVDSQIIGQGSMLKALCVLAKEKFEKDEALERALLAKTELGGFKEQASECVCPPRRPRPPSPPVSPPLPLLV
jgi:hypothetical protein